MAELRAVRVQLDADQTPPQGIRFFWADDGAEISAATATLHLAWHQPRGVAPTAEVDIEAFEEPLRVDDKGNIVREHFTARVAEWCQAPTKPKETDDGANG